MGLARQKAIFGKFGILVGAMIRAKGGKTATQKERGGYQYEM